MDKARIVFEVTYEMTESEWLAFDGNVKKALQAKLGLTGMEVVRVIEDLDTMGYWYRRAMRDATAS